jgi:hypothetical protein
MSSVTDQVVVSAQGDPSACATEQENTAGLDTPTQTQGGMAPGLDTGAADQGGLATGLESGGPPPGFPNPIVAAENTEAQEGSEDIPTGNAASGSAEPPPGAEAPAVVVKTEPPLLTFEVKTGPIRKTIYLDASIDFVAGDTESEPESDSDIDDNPQDFTEEADALAEPIVTATSPARPAPEETANPEMDIIQERRLTPKKKVHFKNIKAAAKRKPPVVTSSKKPAKKVKLTAKEDAPATSTDNDESSPDETSSSRLTRSSNSLSKTLLNSSVIHPVTPPRQTGNYST